MEAIYTQEESYDSRLVFYRASDSSAVTLPLQKPFITSSDRLTYVTTGTIQVSVNMHPFELSGGQLLYTAKNSIVMIQHESSDLVFYSSLLTVTPMGNIHPHHCVFQTDDTLRQRLVHYFALMELMHDSPDHVVDPLQQSMLADVFSGSHPVDVVSHPTRQQRIYNSFIELVAEHAFVDRTVAYYAERLNISPSRLMAIVKQVSGRTVLQWIDLRISLQAKALLAYSDKTIGEIGRLIGMPDANYFSRFFKRQTGMTPSRYRSSKF